MRRIGLRPQVPATGARKTQKCTKWLIEGAKGVWTPCFAPVQLSFAPVQEDFGALGPKDLLHPLLTTLGTFEVRAPVAGTRGRKNWGCSWSPTTPGPNTSAKASQYKWQPYRNANCCGVCTAFTQEEGILLQQEHRDRNGRFMGNHYPSPNVKNPWDSNRKFAKSACFKGYRSRMSCDMMLLAVLVGFWPKKIASRDGCSKLSKWTRRVWVANCC